MIIVTVPGINCLGKNKGSKEAGKEVVKSLENVHSNSNGKIIDIKLLNIQNLNLDNFNIEEQEKKIYSFSSECLKSSEKTVFLGGDHSISYSIGRAFLDYCKNKEKEPCLIVFDAHADCMESMREPTHEEWLRALIEKGFPIKNILLIGARNLWKSEIEFLSEKKIRRISINELRNNLEEVTDIIMEFSDGKELYVSLDIDVVDAVFCPNTGYPEIGGLESRELIYIFSRLNKMKNLKAVDIVEVNCEKENITVKMAGKILSELV